MSALAQTQCVLPQLGRSLRSDFHACARVAGRLRSGPRQYIDLAADKLLRRLRGQHAIEVLSRPSEYRPASREIQARQFTKSIEQMAGRRREICGP